jgi:hypothetical protein
MKRIVTALLTVAVFAAIVILTTTSKQFVRAVYAQSPCSNATLTGSYGFSFSGFTNKAKSANSKLVPFYGEGLFTFDGIGSASATYTYSINGDGGIPNNPYTATYTVNSDCTGSMIANPPSIGDNFAFVIVSSSAEVLATDTSAPDTLNLDMKKQ